MPVFYAEGGERREVSARRRREEASEEVRKEKRVVDEDGRNSLDLHEVKREVMSWLGKKSKVEVFSYVARVGVGRKESGRSEFVFDQLQTSNVHL